MSEDALIRQVFDEVRAANQRPMLHFALSERGDAAGLCDSKVGGVPYLPAGEEWPLGPGAEPLGFLAQINCADLAPLPGFPHEGLLQFFIGTDRLMGAPFGEGKYLFGDGYRVLYRGSVDDAVAEADVVARMPEVDPDNFPLQGGPYRMTFDDEASMQPITCGDGRFDFVYAQRWGELRPDLPLDGLYDACDYASDDDMIYDLIEVGDESFEWKAHPDEQPGNQCGGYPGFAQEDPRDADMLRELDVVLFQLNTTVSELPDGTRSFWVCWGDGGIGTFFINSDALARGDFSRVAYTWDCF